MYVTFVLSLYIVSYTLILRPHSSSFVSHFYTHFLELISVLVDCKPFSLKIMQLVSASVMEHVLNFS